jgi:G:T/U-mismatch repair DNA glycosylase
MISLSAYRPVSDTKADLAPLELENAVVEEEKKHREELARTALGEALKKQIATAQKRAAAIQALSVSADQAKKDIARERLKEIKKRIEELLRMLAMFGGKGAKAVLQELKQLSNELRQAAAILNAPSGSSGEQAAPQTDAGAEGRQAYAEQQVSADVDAADVASGAGAADAAGASATGTGAGDAEPGLSHERDAGVGTEHRERTVTQEDSQRAEDQRLIEELKRKLDGMRVWVERMAKQEEIAQRRGAVKS